MKQKINIFEELNKMKGFITTKPGVVISEQNTKGSNLSDWPECIQALGVQPKPVNGIPGRYSVFWDDNMFFNNGNVLYGDSGKERPYSCQGKKLMMDNMVLNEPTSTSAPRTTPSGYGGAATPPVVANNSNVKGNTSQNKGANYTTMVANGSKSIQTSLGMSPTGQLTDDDLQKILSKLNGETPQGGNQTPQGLPTTADGQLDLQKILASL